MSRQFSVLIKFLIPILILANFWSWPARAQENLPIFEYKEVRRPPAERYVPDEIIVKFKPGVPQEKISETYQKEQITQEKYRSPFADFRVLKIPTGKTVEEMVYRFQKNPLVDYAEPNSIASAFMVPNDPYYQYQWHLDNPAYGGIQMEEAWNITSGNSTIVAAIVDTGIAYENYGTKYKIAPDLTSTNFWVNSDEIAGNGIDDDSNGYIDDRNGWDFINSDAHPNDDNSHGTHVAGTVAQSTNNNTGVAGIAFNTSLMPVKVLDKNGSGTAQTLADGVYYAANNGAKIINMSLGWPPGYDPGTTVHNAITYAYNQEVTLVAATGNDNASTISYPAKYSEVIAVGATRYDENRAPYSNYGEGIDVVAPGGDTAIDQNGDGNADGVLQNTFNPTSKNPSDFGYYFFQGTSMATPHVVGVAALILAQNPSFTPDQVRQRLQTTAEDKGAAGWDQYYGWGIVDAYTALSYSPVAISITTDGTIEFGTVALEATVDSLGDVQTIHVDTGPVDLKVKSNRFSDGTNYWNLGASNSANQVKWDFSKEGTTWYVFAAPDTLYSLANNLATGANQDIFFQLLMPTSSSSSNQYAVQVTVVATSP